VWGAEADINVLGTSSDRFSEQSTDTIQVRPTPGGGTTADDELDVSARTTGSAAWLSTLRLRAGATWDRTLFYATGGLALGGVDSTTNLDVTFHCISDCGAGLDDETASWRGSSSSTQLGWVAGLGAQFAVTDQLSTKLEYLHYDLGTTTYTASPETLPPGLTGLSSTDTKAKAKIDGSLFRIGLNYRF
jgi:outer membrane immunogenic protein